MREVRVSDVTMKQAASTKELSLTFKEKLEMAKLLDRLGASVVEIEGIEKPKVDSLRIKSIASIVKNSVLAVPVKLDDEANIEAVWAALKDAPHARLQVQASVSPAQMEYIYRKKADGMADSIEAAVAKCAQLTDDVEFIAEDATRADQAFLSQVITKAVAAGAKTVTVADAAGLMLPKEFSQFLTDLREATPALQDVALGVSCANTLYMADACAVAAVIIGVDEIKAASYDLDVVSMEKISKILADKSDVCQARCSVRATELKRISSQIAWICESGAATAASVVASAAEPDASIELTAQDTLETVSAAAAKLGYDLSAEDAVSVFEAFQRIVAKKDVVGSRELDAIVASAALQVPATYVLDNYIINSGNTIRATARVQINKGEEELEAVSVGDGPIDAAFHAIEQIAGSHYELDDFQIQSVTEGQEAMGETIIKLVSDGKVYSGRGISTDIVGSAIRAYVNALNKIVYEEQN
ncbi:MAG: alpha-isopropylmalate synthase regulatory domain-containing protein [Coriobacteriia bacterium]|nr:alpha-isopropylmalate synthase regulatory domain-containing protein [Coriobacteriia bacterium]